MLFIGLGTRLETSSTIAVEIGKQVLSFFPVSPEMLCEGVKLGQTNGNTLLT